MVVYEPEDLETPPNNNIDVVFEREWEWEYVGKYVGAITTHVNAS